MATRVIVSAFAGGVLKSKTFDVLAGETPIPEALSRL
jgi:hypothetical protein